MASVSGALGVGLGESVILSYVILCDFLSYCVRCNSIRYVLYFVNRDCIELCSFVLFCVFVDVAIFFDRA